MPQDGPLPITKGILFGEAAEAAGKQLYGALPIAMDTAWARQATAYISTALLPLGDWFKIICVFLSGLWIVYRTYLVASKPLEELASLLGFDIPLTPVVDLADVKADGAVVRWTLRDKQKGKRGELKYDIQLNGHAIAAVDFREGAVSIERLQPASFYVVRVALVNGMEFASKSGAIRFRTKARESGDFFDEVEHDTDGAEGPLHPLVKPFRGLKDITPASSSEAAPLMARQSSSGLAPRKSISGRRSNPHIPQVAQGSKLDMRNGESTEPSEGVETVQQLTELLDVKRKENDEYERIAKEEEEEELRQKDDLIRQRDASKSEAAEKEKASRNLKKEVNQLERQNTAAQNERSKQERLLEQKKQERQKLKDDTLRWQREAQDFKTEVERLKQDRTRHVERMAEDKEFIRIRQTEEATTMRNIEDEIKTNTTEIKKLERTTKSSSPVDEAGWSTGPEISLVRQMQQDAEEERAWQAHRNILQQQYAQSVQRLEAMKQYQREQAEYLARIREERRRQQAQEAQQQQQAIQAVYGSPVSQAPNAELSLGSGGLRRGDSTRSRRGTSGPSSNDSPRMANFAPIPSPLSGAPSLPSTTVTSAFSSMGVPFLNIHNGMTTGLPSDDIMSDEDRDRLTGGAPMSPNAAADLLPADLFAGEGDDRKAENIRPLPGLGGLLPGMPTLPGLGAPPSSSPAQQSAMLGQDHDSSGSGGADRGPASPASIHSRPQSIFASPQASQNNLHLGSPDNALDSDRRSIRSVRSNRAPSQAGPVSSGSRFSSMFGIRPRVKTVSLDDPGLGFLALGKTQSTSLPRQDVNVGLPGIDSATRKRNSSISGTHVFGGALSSSSAAHDSPETQESETLGRIRRPKTFFGFGGKDKDSGGWPSSFTKLGGRPGSPRPGSTHSTELPRPSMDSSRWGVDAWPSTDSGARNSPLSFGPGTAWNAPLGPQPRTFGSRHPSRRPSVQYGASGPPDDIPEDDLGDALDPDSEPMLAPIGTRPAKGKAAISEESGDEAAAARKTLNPAAKSFNSFLNSMKISSKDRDRSKEATATPSASASGTPHVGPQQKDTMTMLDEDSPPASRKSKDTRSLLSATESSLAETSSRASNDNLMRTPSLSTYSDVAPPTPPPQPLVGSHSSAGKESLMQKISRKTSSSGKFGLSTFSKREKPSPASTLTPHTSAGEYDDFDDGGMSSSVGSLPPSKNFSPDAPASGPVAPGDAAKELRARESKESARSSGRSWSSLLKVGGSKNKKDGAGASVSGFSMTSEAASGSGDATEEER